MDALSLSKIFKICAGVCIALEIVFLGAKAAGVSISNAWAILPLGGVLLLLAILFAHIIYWKVREDWFASVERTSNVFGVPRKAVSFWVSELALIGAFFSREHKDVGKETHFSSHGPLTPVLISLMFLSIVEIVVVHLAIGVEWLRWAILIVSVYALIVLTGFYLSVRRSTHTVTDELVVIRSGQRLRISIPVHAIEHCGRRQPGSGGSVKVVDGTVRIPVLSQVNTFIDTSQPVVMEDLSSGRQEVTCIEFFADQRDELIELLSRKKC